MGVCNYSMFCFTILYVHSSIAIILMGKRELVALLNLSSWCLVMVEWLFLAGSWGCLRSVIVVFPDHTRLLFLVDPLLASTPCVDQPPDLLEQQITDLYPSCAVTRTMAKKAKQNHGTRY